MRDDADRRTEPGSARQIREARKQGRVAHSRDLIAVVSLAAAGLAAWAGANLWVQELRALGEFGLLLTPAGLRAQNLEFGVLIKVWMRALLVLSLPILAASATAAVLTGLAYNGWVFAPASLSPKFERINPGVSLNNLFAPHIGIELLKSLLKVMLLTGALWLIIVSILPTLVRLPMLHSIGLPALLFRIFIGFFALMLVGLGMVAAFDAWYQRVRYQRELRMTREEVRREQRDELGDEHIRAQRKALLQANLQDTPLQRCAQATVVISASGQGVAVALFWDRDSAQAPWLINKGRDALAVAIMQIAREKNIAMLEDAALCKRIYTQIGIDGDLTESLTWELVRYFE